MAKSTEKTFTVAGTSVYEGATTFRFANGDLEARRKALEHFGHTKVKLIELPRAMTKVSAMTYMLKNAKGIGKAILPTRSTDPKYKSPILIEALARAGKVKNPAPEPELVE